MPSLTASPAKAVPSETWRQIFCAIGGLVVGVSALTRLAGPATARAVRLLASIAKAVVAARSVVGTAKPGSGRVSRAEVTKTKAPLRRRFIAGRKSHNIWYCMTFGILSIVFSCDFA
jgi:hypothetical protein